MKKGYKHARHILPNEVYHIISRTIYGEMRFRPDRHGKLDRLHTGIISRAKKIYPEVEIFAFALLSNHGHWMIRSGCPRQASAFIRFIKVELSRRWGPVIGKIGPQWESARFKSTALPSQESQRKCFKYILSQSVKEGLIKCPLKWPGPHAAKYWFQKRRPLKGVWINGTKLSNAKHQRKVLKEFEYTEKETFDLDVLESLDLSPSALKKMHKKILQEGQEVRKGKPFLGLDKIYSQKIHQSSRLPHINWLYRRGTIVAWVSKFCKEAREYLRKYFIFQQKFREAADALKQGIKRDFPIGCWEPIRFIEV